MQSLGNHQQALADLDAAARLGDQEPELLYRRGPSRLNLGDAAGAHYDWSEHLKAYARADPSPFANEIDQAVATSLELKKVWTIDRTGETSIKSARAAFCT